MILPLKSFKLLRHRGVLLISSSSAAYPLNPDTKSEILDRTPIVPSTKAQLKTLVLNQYSNGKFSKLVGNVVASPSVLLAACQNLAHPPVTSVSYADSALSSSNLIRSVSRRLSIEEMGVELRSGKFDVESCCLEFAAKSRRVRGRDESLVLPDLRLKVLIEAIRMVLEIVYDDRFVTFAYGGRVGMGRHTLVRYLKDSVENPRWWFGVSFGRKHFDQRNIEKLCSFVGEKIKDRMLIDIIKRLFETGIIRIEFGGSYLGRGFPQECGLCAILINIYFNGFDRDIQEMRLKMKQRNPEVGETPNVFYKPQKVYAVRYLDEILVMTSGSKMMIMDLKKRMLEHLEGKLELRVDRNKTNIHSAVSEKINFLGMELQAVPPSVLRQSMTEKAMRAQKKYHRQKEVKALELKNARERNRKKLGLKIFRHVLKKLKQSNGFKFEFEIETEVEDIFKSWADEVVQEFLGSLEERWKWHRLLKRGDFLSLRHIRDQLPQDLVDAYDEFQQQVDKYLNPVKAKKALEAEERRKEKDEERRYAEKTVEDLIKLSMKVCAPVELVKKAVRMAGFTNEMGRPRPITRLVTLDDADIIKWYAGIGRRWLDFFCCCHNFKWIKIVVSYHMRFSCLLTLAEKHESTKREAIRHYTKDLRVVSLDGTEEVFFPGEREVKMMGDKNLSDPKPVDGLLTMVILRLASDEPPRCCSAYFCDRTDASTYRVQLLQNHSNVDPMDNEKWVEGMGAIHEGLNRRCIPLCPDHIQALYMGCITLQDIDSASFLDLD